MTQLVIIFPSILEFEDKNMYLLLILEKCLLRCVPRKCFTSWFIFLSDHYYFVLFQQCHNLLNKALADLLKNTAQTTEGISTLV